MAALFFHVFLDRQGHDPLAAISVVNVFPLGAYALLEEHVIGVWHDLVNRVSVVVHLPKVLDSAEAVHLMEDVFVMTPLLTLLLLFVVTQGVNIPKGPPKHRRRVSTSNE